VRAVADLGDAGAAAAELVFVARPGNPTLAVPAVRPAGAGLVVVDEAYQPLCDDVPSLAPGPQLAVLRSLTKVFALPGLRLGYLLAAPTVAQAVRAALPPWNVSQPAIAAGLAALAEPTEPVRAAVRDLRRRLVARLEGAGARVTVAGGTFVVVDVGDGARVTSELLVRGVRVRDCASFGLPSLVRIGVCGEGDQERLMRAWEAMA
jgi:histidinol-phosphate/aromatic aminotransferase/cobyric acid decarboxylase-like protein